MQSSPTINNSAIDQYLSSILSSLNKNDLPTQNLINSWNSVFKPYLKDNDTNGISTVALDFYRQIISEAYLTYGDILLKNRHHAVASFISKCYRYIGDIYRYTHMRILSEENYHNAHLLTPKEGSIYSQESLLYLDSPIARMYYISLDIACPNPSRSTPVERTVQSVAASTSSLYKSFFKSLTSEQLKSIPSMSSMASFSKTSNMTHIFSMIGVYPLFRLLQQSQLHNLDFLVAEIFNDLLAIQSNKPIEYPMKRLQMLVSTTFHINNSNWFLQNDSKPEWTQEWPIEVQQRDLPILCHINVILSSFMYWKKSQVMKNLLTFYGNALVHNAIRASNCPVMYVLDHLVYHCPEIIPALDYQGLSALHKRIMFLYEPHINKKLLEKIEQARFFNDESPLSFKPLSNVKAYYNAPNSNLLRTLRFFKLTNGSSFKHRATLTNADIASFMDSPLVQVDYEPIDHLLGRHSIDENKKIELFDW